MGAITQEMFYTLRAYGIWFNKVNKVERAYDDAGRLQTIYVHLSHEDSADWQVFPGSKFRTVAERHAVLVAVAGPYAVELLRGMFRTWLGGTETSFFPCII
jgi:hypothetical protein